MVQDEKTRAEIRLRLFEAAWQNFERQRAHEWKFAIVIWTALAAFAAIALKEDVTISSTEAFVLVAAALLLVAMLLIFQLRVQRGHACNLQKAYLYEKHLNEDAGVTFENTPVATAIEKVKGFGHGWM